ncbi:MAG: DUF4177 domain-containing protein [Mycobacteriales bacterium]
MSPSTSGFEKETTMYEYKVLTERDKRFSDKFDPDVLQTALNAYGADGWWLAESVLVSAPMKSSKTELLLILERSRAT